MKFAGVKLTEESIQKARKWFADNAMACIEEVISGSVKVNNREAYFEWQERVAREYIEGKWDHTVAFMQRAYFIQTGECVPLLP